MLNPMAELSKIAASSPSSVFFGPLPADLTVSAVLNHSPHSIRSVSSASFFSTTRGVNLRSFPPSFSMSLRVHRVTPYPSLPRDKLWGSSWGGYDGLSLTSPAHAKLRTKLFFYNTKCSADAAPRCGVFFFSLLTH